MGGIRKHQDGWTNMNLSHLTTMPPRRKRGCLTMGFGMRRIMDAILHGITRHGTFRDQRVRPPTAWKAAHPARPPTDGPHVVGPKALAWSKRHRAARWRYHVHIA